MQLGRRTLVALTSALLAALTLLAGAPIASAVSASSGGSGPSQQFAVKFDAGVDRSARMAALKKAGLVVADEGSGGWVLVEGPAGRTAGLSKAFGVDVVEPVAEVTAFATPNDPLYSYQWHMQQVQADQAWSVTTGTGAVVAVIDTGVTVVPDLASTAFVPGYDFVSGDTDASDENGHGTHVAGTIAQSTNNGVGVAGVAPGAAIMPVRALDANGSGSTYTIGQAIRWAADNGADVVNMSLGTTTDTTSIRDAVAYAVSKGVVVVAASGNAGASTLAYPAAYPETVSVGATRYDQTRPSYSNYGSGLDLVAPGGDTSRDQNNDGKVDGVLQQTLKPGSLSEYCYCFYQGTSMAAPHVAGVAALLMSTGLSADLVDDALTATALDLGATGWDEYTGAGLVQAASALAWQAPVSSPTTDGGTTDGGTTDGGTSDGGTSDGGTTDPGTTDPGTTDPGTEEPTTEDPTTTPLEPVVRDLSFACPETLVPDAGFTDVSDLSGHARAIDCVAWWSVAAGVGDNKFNPSGSVTRAQMATFLARALGASGVALPSSAPDAFVDDNGSAHETSINQLAALGVVKGTGPDTYSPEAVVKRAQMATFLARFVTEVTGVASTATADWFTDDEGSNHEANINAMYEAGIAAGTGDGVFSPDGDVRRDHMASFLARALDLLVESGHATLPLL